MNSTKKHVQNFIIILLLLEQFGFGCSFITVFIDSFLINNSP